MKETERVPKKQRDKNINLVIRSGFKIHLIGIIHSLQKKRGALQKYVPLCQKVSKVIQISTDISFKQTRLVYGSTLKYC